MLPDSQDRAEKQLALLKKQIAQRKEAEEALRRESAIVKLLQEVAVAANEARAIEPAFQFALNRICTFTGWPVGHVYKVEAETGELLPSSIWHCDDRDHYRSFIETTMNTRFTAGEGWLGKLLVTGKPQWITDIGDNPDFIRSTSLGETDLRAGLAIPALVGTEVVAVLEFFFSQEAEPDDDLLEVMAPIGAQLGRVVERVQAEESLRDSQQRLQQGEALLAEAERIAHLGSWQWDIEQDRVAWSAEMCRIYGLKAGRLSLDDFLERVHPEDRHNTREVIGAAYAAKESFEFFHRIVRPDGEVRLLHARGKPVLDETGELTGMVGTGQDVTELKQAEEKLEHTAQQLTALNEMGQTVTASLELEDVFQRVLTTLRPLLNAEGIFILLLDGDELVFAATDKIGTGSLDGQRVPVTAGVAGEVIDTGRPIWVYGEETRRRIYRHIEERTGYQPAALLATPLTLRGEWIGVMEAVHSSADAFDAGDLRLLEAAAAWTAIAIGNARLFEAQQRARRTAEVMRNANEELTQTLDLNAVLASLLEHLHQLIGYDSAVVMLLDRGSQLRIRATHNYDADTVLHRRVHAESYPYLQKLLSAEQNLSVDDAQDDVDCRHLPGFPDEIQSILGVPLRVSGQVLGLCLLAKEEPGYFDRRHQLLAESLAGQAAIALQNAQLFAEVRASRERLRYLTGKVVSAQEEERRRVSRELHDEAGQALMALKMSLNAIKVGLPEDLQELREQVAQAVELTGDTMEQIRLLAHDLRPPVLDTFSLNSALEGLAHDFADRSQLSIIYQGAELPSLRDPIAISFYRFLQEALTNVVKYADASHVHVILDVNEETVKLTVTDDGQGFVPSEKISSSKGIGLVGVQERFELLGGHLQIDSEPGRGTKLTASAPLEPRFIKEREAQ